MTTYVVQLDDQNAAPAGILCEDWTYGTKPSVTTAAARFGPFTQAAVQVKNLSDKTIFVRADDGTAADDGRSDPLPPGASDNYAIVSGDNKVSLLAAASITTGAVYLMPVKGTR